MKKYLLVGMVVALSLLTACGKKDFSKMTFNDDKYKKAQIAVQGFSTYADKLVEVQDPDQVDAVSGATVSNKEFKEAVWNALDKAKK